MRYREYFDAGNWTTGGRFASVLFTCISASGNPLRDWGAMATHPIYSVICIIALLFAVVVLLRQLRSLDASQRWWTQPGVLSKTLGLCCGVAIRLMFGVMAIAPKQKLLVDFSFLLSFGFLFVSPFAIGLVTSYYDRDAEESPRLRWWESLLASWGPIVIAFLIAGAIGLEGMICLLMALPLWLAIGSLGGLIGWLLAVRTQGPKRSVLCSALALPFIVVLLELPIRLDPEVRYVETAIEIHAPANVIWSEIRSVRPIEPWEHRPSLFVQMGFPRPIAAELEGEGVGAIRLASFEGNLVFTERVTAWEPERRLAFTIDANTEQIPATTLDEHVTVGGPFFDVLFGEYRIEPLKSGGHRLHLSSSHRLNTSFNWYAGFWSALVMNSIQENILEIIKLRCESSNEDRRVT